MGRQAEEKRVLPGQSDCYLDPGLPGRCTPGEVCASRVEAEDPLVGEWLHTWAEVVSLLRPGRERSAAEVKVSPYGKNSPESKFLVLVVGSWV